MTYLDVSCPHCMAHVGEECRYARHPRGMDAHAVRQDKAGRASNRLAAEADRARLAELDAAHELTESNQVQAESWTQLVELLNIEPARDVVVTQRADGAYGVALILDDGWSSKADAEDVRRQCLDLVRKLVTP